MKLSKPMKLALAEFNADTFEQLSRPTLVRGNTLCALEKKGLIESLKPASVIEAFGWGYRECVDRKWKLTEEGAKIVNSSPLEKNHD
jgi:hypothetical protein